MRTIITILLSLANALFMLWLTFFLLSITQVLPDEYELVRWTSIGKNLVLKMEKKPDSSRFLFVNVAWDKLLIDKIDESISTGVVEKKPSVVDFWLNNSTKESSKKQIEQKKDTSTNVEKGEIPLDTLQIPSDTLALPKTDTIAQNVPDLNAGLGDIKLPMGSIAITDRAKLAAFMNLLKRRPNHKVVLLDVNFKDNTPYDSLLTELINTVPRTLVSSHIDDNNVPEPLDLKIKPISLSNLEKAYGMALKFKLFYNDSIKTTPIRIYETIYNKKFKKTNWFYYLGDKPVLNSFILDYRIRKYHYDTQKYAKVHLGEWISPAYKSIYMPCVPSEYNIDSIDVAYAEDFIHKLTKDKIIIVGDFEDRDIHETIYGAIPGPMILLDAFLAVEAGDNVIAVGFLLLLFLSYWFISYVTFMYNQIYPKWVEKLIYRRTDYQESFFETFTVYLLFFAILSVTSFFLFNIHVGVLVLAFYMNILEKIRKWNLTQRLTRFILREKVFKKEA